MQTLDETGRQVDQQTVTIVQPAEDKCNMMMMMMTVDLYSALHRAPLLPLYYHECYPLKEKDFWRQFLGVC